MWIVVRFDLMMSAALGEIFQLGREVFLSSRALLPGHLRHSFVTLHRSEKTIYPTIFAQLTRIPMVKLKIPAILLHRCSGFGFQKCFSRNFQLHRRDPTIYPPCKFHQSCNHDFSSNFCVRLVLFLRDPYESRQSPQNYQSFYGQPF